MWQREYDYKMEVYNFEKRSYRVSLLMLMDLNVLNADAYGLISQCLQYMLPLMYSFVERESIIKRGLINHDKFIKYL